MDPHYVPHNDSQVKGRRDHNMSRNFLSRLQNKPQIEIICGWHPSWAWQMSTLFWAGFNIWMDLICCHLCIHSCFSHSAAYILALWQLPSLQHFDPDLWFLTSLKPHAWLMHDSAQFSPFRASKYVTADLIMTAAPLLAFYFFSLHHDALWLSLEERLSQLHMNHTEHKCLMQPCMALLCNSNNIVIYPMVWTDLTFELWLS